MIRTEGSWFKDEWGRTLILRGVNLGGSSKVPSRPNGATYIREGFFEHQNVSFVGRPFPLEEADEHFSRLRAWGLTFLRFLITWEAVEHGGPGVYDREYLDYLYAVVRKAGEHGIDLFIDPHQDMWSRFSGGDGAPGWTLDAVGLDMTRFAETGAAIVHAVHGDPFPRMIWPTNGGKLATATMFTLFFAGNELAPKTKVDGEPVQEFLQRHYCQAMRQVAERLKALPNVVGYDVMNEPLMGYVGWRDLGKPGGLVKLGQAPTAFQGMALGDGIPQEVEIWEPGPTGSTLAGAQVVNAEGARAWRDGVDCIWRQHGVWDVDEDGAPRLLQPEYFTKVRGRRLDFNADGYRPFANRYAREIRAADPEALIFVETEPSHRPPIWTADDAPNVVYGPHWYDALVLFQKEFHPDFAVDFGGGLKIVLGSEKIRRSFRAQLARFKRQGLRELGGVPVIIGEIGIPFDLGDRSAYKTGDFSPQMQALDRSLRAIEDNLLNCTVWNYTADNRNERGDQWNDEDLSIFSRDQQNNPADINSGGRALEAMVRPYARAVAGEPLRMSFDVQRRVFEFVFRHDATVAAPTEIYVPAYQYPNGYGVKVSDGTYEVREAEQVLLFTADKASEVHTIRLKPR